MTELRAAIDKLYETRHDYAEAQGDPDFATTLVSELGAVWDALRLIADRLDEQR